MHEEHNRENRVLVMFKGLPSYRHIREHIQEFAASSSESKAYSHRKK